MADVTERARGYTSLFVVLHLPLSKLRDYEARWSFAGNWFEARCHRATAWFFLDEVYKQATSQQLIQRRAIDAIGKAKKDRCSLGAQIIIRTTALERTLLGAHIRLIYGRLCTVFLPRLNEFPTQPRVKVKAESVLNF